MTDPNTNLTPSAAVEALVARVADEFETRRAAGEDPDPEEYAARHPEAADEIRGVLALFGGGMARGLARPGGPPAALEDFRIVREIGRGGMGVVYEAEQLSLRRRVALKVLPFAAVSDPRHLQRFRNEALAAAGLDHPHVVRVYGVGQDRGVHFIAMQLVDGRSLADLIRERRGEAPAGPELTPADAPRASGREPSAETAPASGARPGGTGSRPPVDAAYARRVAGWGADAADALEHAHALGVVHRDVKPGNLLVDGRGGVYVVDFGLARMAADPGVTGIGDLLGTLRYMSPEQAAARHGLVDHRSDVYSLGATLYELLTLEPAFVGADRAAVLAAVADTDPVPPRALDRRIPRDLETVVLKCLEKDPAHRYQSAKELADDLRRFLADRPVRAKPPTARHRVGKWARRNRALVWSLAAAALAGGAALAAATVLITGAYEAEAGRRRQAEAAADRERAGRRADAVGALAGQCEDALRGEDAARAAVALGAADRRAAEGVPEDLAGRLARCREELDLLRALDEADEFRYARVGDRLASREEVTARLQAVVGNYRVVPGVTPDGEAALRVNRSLVRDRLLTALDLWLGGSHSAEVAALLRAADPDPFRTEFRAAVAARDVARVRELADRPEVLDQPAYFAAAIGAIGPLPAERRAQVLTRALARWPNHFRVLMTLAALHRTNAPGSAALSEKWYRAAAAVRPGSAVARTNLGDALFVQGQLEPALAEIREAIRLDPGNGAARYALGRVLVAKGDLDGAVAAFEAATRENLRINHVYYDLGLALYARGDVAKAGAAFEDATRVDPGHFNAHLNLGNVRYVMGDLDGAITAYRHAIRLRPDQPAVYSNLGNALSGRGDRAEAIATYRVALRLDPQCLPALTNLAWELATGPDPKLRDPARAVAEARQAVELSPQDGGVWRTLGAALYRAGDWAAAVEALNKSTELLKGGGSAEYFFLAMAHGQLGDRAAARRWYDRGVGWMERHEPRGEDLRRFRAEAEDVLGILAPPPRRVAR